MGKGFRDWVLRYGKGMLIGAGFILPGVSGGALAAVLGIYRRLIAFLAHLTRDFGEQFCFFLPVGLGGVTGVVLLSHGVSYLLDSWETQMLWFFIGCVLGTLPTLWEQAGEGGRRWTHLAAMAVAGAGLFLLLRMSGQGGIEALSPGFSTWLLAGGLIGLGAVIPGLSPSNFLLYLGLYKPLTDSIKGLELGAVLPVGAGAVICVLLLSRGMDALYNRAYGWISHVVLGIVAASTAAIIPRPQVLTAGQTVAGGVLLVVGMVLGLWMGYLEKKYKG